MTSALASTSQNAPPSPARVMIVDDSVVVRGLTSRWLEEAGFSVVATCSNGKVAVEQIERARPDIVILDIEMPEMDGLEALPLLLAKAPRVTVIVISTLTQRNAQVSLKCLSMGATDYLPKPESHRGVTTSTSFRQELIAKVQGLASRARRTTGPAPIAPPPPPARPLAAASLRADAPAPSRLPLSGQIRPAPQAAQARLETTRVSVRPRPGLFQPKALLIGSSTGGPRAVGEVLSAMAPTLRRLPTLIVQHMPPIFTAVFAEHLSAQTGVPAAEGKDGEPLQAGRIYVAPGGKHMALRRDGSGICVRIDDGPPENFCKPAVDVLFRDAAAVWGGSTLAVVLTGMGSDGALGAKAIVGAGGLVLAQDEATSTVWGMPGAVAKAGLAHDILPLPSIAPALERLITGGAA